MVSYGHNCIKTCGVKQSRFIANCTMWVMSYILHCTLHVNCVLSEAGGIALRPPRCEVKCDNNTLVIVKEPLIRASVDTLYMDGTGEIARDLRTKCLKTWREWLTIAWKLLAIVYRPISSYTYLPRLPTGPQFPMRELALTQFHDFRVVIIIIIIIIYSSSSGFFFSKPTISYRK